jgi:hypothetical protein
MAFRIRNINMTNSEPDLVVPENVATENVARKTANPTRFRHNVSTGINKYLPPDIPQVNRMVPETEELVYDKITKKWKLVKTPK